jgi:hypothetical protein
MAGKIIADTLETGAGADIPTSYVVNGSAKAWVNFNGTGTIAARDSLNVSSLTDSGTGNYRVVFSSALANDDYVGGGTFNWSNNGNQINCIPNTTAQGLALILENNAFVDRSVVNVSYLGDLA